MALKIENSVLAGLATATVVYGVYQAALPSSADIRSLDAQNTDVAGAEKVAEWTSAAIVSGVSLIAKDPTIFIIGGSMVIAMAWVARHANAVTPTLKSLVPAQTPRVTQTEAPAEYSSAKAPAYDSTF